MLLTGLLMLALAAGPHQSDRVLDDAVARKNLVKSQAPVYPAIAQAAHVTGVVELEVGIGVDGYVSEARVVSGPAMLKGAALDAVAHWQFKPFLTNGKPESVKAKLRIPFAAHGATVAAEAPEIVAARLDEATAKEFFALSDECHRLIAANQDTAAQAKACQAAADEANKFAPQTRFIERRSSNVYAASALLRNQDLPNATVYANNAVTVVLQGHDDGSGSSAAYAVRGQAEAYNGELDKADADLAQAEEFEREAIKSIGSEGLVAEYKGALRHLLGFHASVLKGLGKDADAAEKLKEADTLQ